MRAFIAISIPEEIKKEIEKIQDKLSEFTGKKTEIENLHLTLKFLGWVDNKKLEEVKKRLKKIKFNKFETEISSIGFFDNRKSRFRQQIIIWLTLTNCENLQAEIDDKLDKLFDKERRFMAHLTIARVKRIKNDKKFFDELTQIKVSAMKFKVNSFELMESKLKRTGPAYSVIERYNLE